MNWKIGWWVMTVLAQERFAIMPFDAAYQTIAWLCWVPSLIVAEWIILRQRAVTTSAAPAEAVIP